jgi:hypothetical protein
MKPLTLLGGAIAVVLLAVWWFYVTRPVVAVSADTEIWKSEYDAAYPGPHTPLVHLRQGEKLRILWVTYGKDYCAYYVAAPQGQRGWVLYGQVGIPPV